jgi:copper homeostasis protein (lipoprotein)
MNKLKSFLTAVFLLILNGLFAQSNTKILPTTPITVNQKGNITLYGKKVELDNLRKELQNTLVKQATIPEEIQITYEGEVGMGMRHEVETQVSEAIAGAKWLKKSKPTVTAKSVTTTPTEFSGSKISVSVDKKGGITLTGKKVALEDLKKELQNQLVKLTAIPTEVPIKFDKNILMGMRGTVRDEVNGAIKGAKWLKKKAALEAANQKMIADLAAFYTGTLPCADCDAIETLLTLNADAKRSFTLEEQYKGKKSKTVESNGTWAVTDGIVTLKGKTASSKYQVTKEGLVVLNTNGSKKDAALGKKYLLKKALGE